MWKIAIKSLLAHKRRLMGTFVAVLLGVVFLAGTLVLGDTMRSAFSTVFTEANSGTDVVVRSAGTIGATEGGSQRKPVPADLAAQLADLPGVALAEPAVEGYGQLVGADGENLGGNGPPTLAGNWLDPAVNPYHLVEGRAPEAPGEAVIDRGSATVGGLAVGDTTTLRTPEPVPITIVGIAALASQDSFGGVTFTSLTLAEAQRLLLGGADEADSIILQAADGTSPEQLAAEVQPTLPAGVEAITGEALTAEQVDSINDDFLGFFQIFLLVFACIALLVTTFTIYNTFSVILAQRTRESALLRALGASRGQVLRATALEAVGVGIVASAVGVALGIALAWGLKSLMDAAGFGVPAGGVDVRVGSVVLAFVVGLAATLVASLLPSIKASRVPPLAALRDVAIDRSATGRLRPILGAVLAVAGVGLVVSGALASSDGLGRVGLGAVVVVAAVVVLGPAAARPAGWVLGAPLAATRGVSGRLARQNAVRNPRRTASTASALLVGVAVVTLFATFGASIKTSIDESVSSSFGGDLVIQSQDFTGMGFSPEMTAQIDALPEVSTATGIGVGGVRLDGQDRSVSVVDPGPLTSLLDMHVVAGDLAGLQPDQLAVDEGLAEERGWQLGTPVPVAYPDGTSAELTVGALYETSPILGSVLLPTAAWAPHARQQTDIAVLIGVAPGVDMAQAKAAVAEVAAPYGAPAPQDRQEYIATVTSGIDQLLTIVYVLLFLSIIIALIGIANTLSLSVYERTRELGLLRAVGQTRPQLRAMVRGESLIVAVFGTIGGGALGLLLGWGLVRGAVASEGLGSFTAPVPTLVVVLVLGAVAGFLAGIIPARRASRLDVLRAITAD